MSHLTVRSLFHGSIPVNFEGKAFPYNTCFYLISILLAMENIELLSACEITNHRVLNFSI